MLLPLLATALPALFFHVHAAPTEPSVLSIPIRDIVNGDVSSHAHHEHFPLYTRWLETPTGAYVKRDPAAALADNPGLFSIDCKPAHDAGCLITSEVYERDLPLGTRNYLRSIAPEPETSPNGLLSRSLSKRARASSMRTVYSWKSYHHGDIAAQHTITINTKCKTIQFSSTSFRLTSFEVHHPTEGTARASLIAYQIGPPDPGNQRSVRMFFELQCTFFGNKCCLMNAFSHNYIGDTEEPAPRKEPIECVVAEDASRHNCENYHSGWCTLHLVQYQKNQGPGVDIGNYRFDLTLIDHDKEVVGEYSLISIPTGQTVHLSSTLPTTFGISTPNVDADSPYMHYGNQAWGINDQEHQCNFGGFDGGKREGDCGFSC